MSLRRHFIVLAAGLVLCLALPGGIRAQSADATHRYREAAASFLRLRASGQARPAQWRQLADAFYRIFEEEPGQRQGADALYSAALSHREAWRSGKDWSDLSRATEAFRRYVSGYPHDRLSDDSLMHLADLLYRGYQDPQGAQDAYRHIIADYADGDQAPAARKHLAELIAAQHSEEQKAPGAGQTVSAHRDPETVVRPAAYRPTDPLSAGLRVKRVQVWSALQWTRVILSTSPGVRYRYQRLPAGKDLPERLYFDLPQAEPVAGLAPVTKVDDAVLEQVRVSHFQSNVTRIVLDLKNVSRVVVKDFSLPNEQKIVVDLYPTRIQTVSAPKKNPAANGSLAIVQKDSATRPASVTLRSSLGLKVRRIMLDPGHGGHDPGAVANGMLEKDLVLDISKRLAGIIRRNHPEIQVGLTRDRDVFIPLQQRPEIAKSFRADLFVSVHLNANPIKRFYGVETYFLNLTSDGSALQVAARENATTEKRVSDLNNILFDLLRDSNIVESSKLARSLQSSLVETLQSGTGDVRDLGVKQAPFLVLMGAEMPSVLVEAGFVTNPKESRRLRDDNYLQQIAQGIYEGLRKYIEGQNIVQRPTPPPAVSQNS